MLLTNKVVFVIVAQLLRVKNVCGELKRRTFTDMSRPWILSNNPWVHICTPEPLSLRTTVSTPPLKNDALKRAEFCEISEDETSFRNPFQVLFYPPNVLYLPSAYVPLIDKFLLPLCGSDFAITHIVMFLFQFKLILFGSLSSVFFGSSWFSKLRKLNKERLNLGCLKSALFLNGFLGFGQFMYGLSGKLSSTQHDVLETKAFLSSSIRASWLRRSLWNDLRAFCQILVFPPFKYIMHTFLHMQRDECDLEFTS